MRIRVRILGWVAASLLSTILVVAQGQRQGQPQAPPQFRSTADFVLLDVSVLDRNRRTVRGLTQADFTVIEDGKPQTIATFGAVDLPEAEALPAKWMGRAVPDVQTNVMPPDGRLIIILMDERQVSATPFAAQAAQATAHAIVDQLSPKDVAAVTFMVRQDGAQEFTADRARLHAAVDTYSMGMYNPTSVLAVLRDLSRLLGGIPDRRKIIIYIGAGQGFDPVVLGSLEKVTTQDGAQADAAMQVGQRQMYDYMMGFFSVAQRSNVNVYAIDPAGLDIQMPGPNGTAPVGGQMTANKEFLRLVSNATGGRAVTGNNTPQSEVPRILAENSSYYMLAYTSTNRRNDGSFHRVQVKVNRQNVEVRARRGYQDGQAGPLATAGVNPALNRLIPSTELTLGLWAAPAGSDPSGSHPVAMMIDVELPREGAPPVEHLSIAWTVVDMTGKPRATGKQDLTVSPPAGDTATYVAGAQAVASLPPGKYDIRLSAVSAERRRRGGLLADVVVPDYSKEAMSATGVFIGGAATRVSRIAVVGEPLGNFLAVAPTSERSFPTDVPMVAAMRIYQTKQPLAPVTIKTTIVDAKDKTVFESQDKLDVASFTADGSAAYRFALPLAKLTPGRHLLRIEASRSGTPPLRRDVLFGVR